MCPWGHVRCESSVGLGSQKRPPGLLHRCRGWTSTLFVTPAGQSLLIDTGWPENAGRDADRIVAATKLAGVNKIDYVLLTHYHNDHSGGVPQLVERIPVGTFIDHGVNIDTKPGGATLDVWNAYQKVLAQENTSTSLLFQAMLYRSLA
jgi:glyoxylase-like metal-dependent hydrolase (beta-lactamase superfamily II)